MGRRKRERIEYKLASIPGRENLYITWTENRKPQRISTGTPDRTEAEIYLRNFIAGLSAPPEGKITVQMVMSAYKDAKKDELGHKGYQTLCNCLKHIDAFFGRLYPENVKAALSREYAKKRREQKISDGTIRRELGSLIAAFNHCKREDWDIAIPSIILPEPGESREIWLTREEMNRLINAAEGHVRLFILIAYHTCARAGAIFELTWDKVGLDTRLIDFRTPQERKTNKRRSIKRINQKLLKALSEALELAQTDYVIEYNGMPVMNNIRKSFATAVQKAGLDKGVTPHILKHTAGVHMAMDRTPMEEIKQIMDHSSIKTTERHYLKYHPDFMKMAARSLGRL